MHLLDLSRMYSPPPNARPLNLRGAHLKIERARKHIADLDAERTTFLGSNVYSGKPTFVPETNRTRFIMETVPGIPEEIPIILGDVVHNLRVALDYLACELVRSVGVEPKRVYFPIFENAEKYKAGSDSQTKGMPEEAKKIIDKNIRPWGGTNDGLWVLHQLDIVDKHRLLVTTAMKVGSWSVTLDQTAKGYGFAFIPALKAGDVIGDVEGNHEADKQMSITVDIAFGEPEILEGKPVIDLLVDLTNYVERVISFFG